MNVELHKVLNPFVEYPAKHVNLHSGDQWLFTFPNGYGASVVSHDGSYGGRSGLWELAVLDAQGELTYATPITSDVLGWLSVDDVRETLRSIATLATVALDKP